MIATNLRSISEFSGIGYTVLYNRLRKCNGYYSDPEEVFIKTKITKGRQRIKELNGKKIVLPQKIPDKMIDMFDEIIK